MSYLWEDTIQHLLVLFQLQQLALQTLQVGAPVPRAAALPILPLEHLSHRLVQRTNTCNTNASTVTAAVFAAAVWDGLHSTTHHAPTLTNRHVCTPAAAMSHVQHSTPACCFTEDAAPVCSSLTLISLARCARPLARSMYSLFVMTDFGRRIYWKIQSMGAANIPQPAKTKNRIHPARRQSQCCQPLSLLPRCTVRRCCRHLARGAHAAPAHCFANMNQHPSCWLSS